MDGTRGTALLASTVVLLVCHSLAVAQPEPADTPRHLALARELVDNIKPQDNRYRLGGRHIGFPGDSASSSYSVQADCSGFLLALFERAQYRVQPQMSYVPSRRLRTRPAAEDFVYSIENEKGYRHIKTVKDMRPGDLLAHAMLKAEDRQEVGTTGHIFLINSLPKPIRARNPIVEGTEQFEVSIIDSNEEYVGPDDTRLADPANRITGLGRGTIRLYADADGVLIGWARTFRNTQRFFSYNPRFPSDTRLRKAAIGRPLPGN